MSSCSIFCSHSCPLKQCWGYYCNLGSSSVLQIILKAIYIILSYVKAKGGAGTFKGKTANQKDENEGTEVKNNQECGKWLRKMAPSCLLSKEVIFLLTYVTFWDCWVCTGNLLPAFPRDPHNWPEKEGTFKAFGCPPPPAHFMHALSADLEDKHPKFRWRCKVGLCEVQVMTHWNI